MSSCTLANEQWKLVGSIFLTHCSLNSYNHSTISVHALLHQPGLCYVKSVHGADNASTLMALQNVVLRYMIVMQIIYLQSFCCNVCMFHILMVSPGQNKLGILSKFICISK